MARSKTERFTFLAAHPCLDFVNTSTGAERTEAIQNFEHLL